MFLSTYCQPLIKFIVNYMIDDRLESRTDVFDFYDFVWMCFFKNSKYFISKSLPNRFDSVKIENDFFEFLQPIKQSFRL
jgi:hypothetical protein